MAGTDNTNVREHSSEPRMPFMVPPVYQRGTFTSGPEPPAGGECDPLQGGETIPVYGPLAAAATSYRYIQQHDPRTLHVEYASRSRLSAICGRPTHRVMVTIWDELFWILSVPLLLVSTLVNAAIRFVLEGVVRPVLLGPLQLIGDHLIKPLSVVQFDALVLPGLTLLANTLGAMMLVFRPLGELLDLLVRPLATLLSSCRLVQITYQMPPSAPATARSTQEV